MKRIHLGGGVMDKSTLVTDQTDEGQSAGDTEPSCLGTGVKTRRRAAFWIKILLLYCDWCNLCHTETDWVLNTALNTPASLFTCRIYHIFSNRMIDRHIRSFLTWDFDPRFKRKRWLNHSLSSLIYNDTEIPGGELNSIGRVWIKDRRERFQTLFWVLRWEK